MALSQAELEQCKNILGFGNLTALARPYFDVAVVFEDVVQKTLDTTWAETYVRGTILVNYYQIDTQIGTVNQRLQATELVGDVKLDARNELRGLLELKDFWADELSKILKIPRVPKAGSSSSIELM